ncbi:MAG: hypothetical protein GXN96_03300 [Aquificae bacterium]|nr:hypothetical protein [Aquificota bacterium]
MFGFIQKHKKIGIALIAVASASFLFWMFSVSDIKQMFQGGSCVVSVKGECVTLREYRFELLKFSELFDNEALRPAVTRFVLRSIITREVLYQKARELGWYVSDEEVLDHIRENELFHENGEFSVKRYREVLERFNLTPAEYENIVRKSIAAQRVLTFLENGVYLLPEEVELQKKFRTTLFYGWLYLIKPSDLKEKPELSEEELRKFYAENRELFKEEGKEVLYLWKTTEKEKAHDLYRTLKEGKIPEGYTLLELPTGAQELPRKVYESTKELSEQNRFRLVKLGEEYYILYLKEKKPERIKPFEEVRSEVEKRLLERKKEDLLEEFARSVAEKLKKGQQVNLKPIKMEETDLDEIQRVLRIPPEELPELVYGKKKVYGPYRAFGGFGVLVVEKKEEGQLTKQELKEIKEELFRTKTGDLQAFFVNYLINKYQVKVREELLK